MRTDFIDIRTKKIKYKTDSINWELGSNVQTSGNNSNSLLDYIIEA